MRKRYKKKKYKKRLYELLTKKFLGAKMNLSKVKEIFMKKFLKKLIFLSLLGGLILAIGKGGTLESKLMNEIDPGPANSVVK